jgi:hypothetical protein
MNEFEQDTCLMNPFTGEPVKFGRRAHHELSAGFLEFQKDPAAFLRKLQARIDAIQREAGDETRQTRRLREQLAFWRQFRNTSPWVKVANKTGEGLLELEPRRRKLSDELPLPLTKRDYRRVRRVKRKGLRRAREEERRAGSRERGAREQVAAMREAARMAPGAEARAERRAARPERQKRFKFALESPEEPKVKAKAKAKPSKAKAAARRPSPVARRPSTKQARESPPPIKGPKAQLNDQALIERRVRAVKDGLRVGELAPADYAAAAPACRSDKNWCTKHYGVGKDEFERYLEKATWKIKVTDGDKLVGFLIASAPWQPRAFGKHTELQINAQPINKAAYADVKLVCASHAGLGSALLDLAEELAKRRRAAHIIVEVGGRTAKCKRELADKIYTKRGYADVGKFELVAPDGKRTPYKGDWGQTAATMLRKQL